MGAFKGAVITKKGQELLAKILNGNSKLEFTQIKTSENVLKGDLATFTDIGAVKQAEKIASVVRQNGTNVKVSASFTNTGLAKGYYVRNIGLYAKDPTEGEILYSISVADEQIATVDWMPTPNGVGVSSLMVDLITFVANSESVNVEVDPTATATVRQIAEVNEHLTALDNAITTTTERALKGSVAGGVKINKVYGKSEQGAEPTPDAPQEIKRVEVSEIIASGKNLLSDKGTTSTSKGITFTVQEDRSIVVNGALTGSDVFYTIGTSFTFLKNQRYIVSGCPAGGSSVRYALFVNGVATEDYGSGFEVVFDEDTTKTIGIYVKTTEILSNVVFKPMIRYADSTDATYEPYKKNSISFSKPMELRKGDFVTGAGKETHTKVIQINSPVTWSINAGMERADTIAFYTDGGYGIASSQGVPYTQMTALCSHFPHSKNLAQIDEECFRIGGTVLYFKVRKDRLASMDSAGLNAYLSTLYPITIEYELANPVVEPISMEDKMALLSLVGHDGATDLSTDSVVTPVIEAEYGTNKLGAHTLTGLLTAQRNELKLEVLGSANNA